MRLKRPPRTISVGDELNLDELIDWLIARGFDRVTAVELPGEFCIHGGILDIFPASEPDAIRIELFGDEIESIRSFNVESQRRLEDLKSISLTATAPTKAPASTNSGERGGVSPSVQYDFFQCKEKIGSRRKRRTLPCLRWPDRKPDRFAAAINDRRPH
jgi:transcription-repair coupling factor (superfamily II helicase)